MYIVKSSTTNVISYAVFQFSSIQPDLFAYVGSNKVNGSVPSSLKNRPRIPTPDVSKESAGMDESKNHLTVPNSTHGIITYGNNIQQSINGSHLYPSEMPVVQVII